MDRVLVDSSVWITYFRNQKSAQTEFLDELLDEDLIQIGDLILMEVLQGFRTDKQVLIARDRLALIPVAMLGGERMAIAAAENYRFLRAKGITVRKTIDMLIGTYCIANNIALLHSDRDFDPLEKHLGLKVYRG